MLDCNRETKEEETEENVFLLLGMLVSSFSFNYVPYNRVSVNLLVVF
jgi:hypothetical protein